MCMKIVLLLALVATGTALLEGPNVCTRQEAYTTTIRVSEQQPYQVKEYAWCFNVPPRCSKYKIKFRQVFKTETLVKHRPVEECCAGYAPDTQGKQCVPVCVDKCVHGKCVAPNACACEHGYGGPACDISCPDGKWGRHCQNDCRCLNGGTCEPLTGECACAPGWRGDACERPCAPTTFGENCEETCHCQNNATCDQITGACDCLPGYTGPLCEERCPNDEKCPQLCRCQNKGKCNAITDHCECTAGWTGQVCANKCPLGKWGNNCSQKCECANGARCHHITGHCQCEAGFTGDKCLELCPLRTYGVECLGTCLCQHGGECNPRNGSCTCRAGWSGTHCGARACADGKWGPRCDQDCECDPVTTEMCDPWTGVCDCAAGWSGESCTRQCPLLTFGKGCRSNCRCENSGHCSPVNGACLCAPGFRGLHCEEKCPYPLYGDNCTDTCECYNNATCSHETGQCICQPGYDGLKCDRPCDGKTYGLKCLQPCNCENDAPCNPVNGECVCGPGYLGSRCERRCQPGFFGQNCSHACNCSSGAVGCHHVTGQCICDSSWRDVLGTFVEFYTFCDVANSTHPIYEVGQIASSFNITRDEKTSHVYYIVEDDNVDFNFGNNGLDNLLSSEEKTNRLDPLDERLTALSLNNCFSFTVDHLNKNTNDIVMSATEVFRKLQLPNKNIIIASMEVRESTQPYKSKIWDVSFNDGRTNLKNIYSGVLVGSKFTGNE